METITEQSTTFIHSYWYIFSLSIATPTLVLYMIRRWVNRVEKRLDILEKDFRIISSKLAGVDEKVVKRNAFEKRIDSIHKERQKMLEEMTELKVSLAGFQAIQSVINRKE